MAGDICIDANAPAQIRQLLHFGLQKLDDPNLDGSLFIDRTSDAPGEVRLPGGSVAS